MVLQLSAQTSREGRVNPGCVGIASRSRVEGEKKNIKEHEREEKSIKIEEKILNKVCSVVCKQKGASISSCQCQMKSTV